MTIINNNRIKDHYVHNLPENRELMGYARENRKAGNKEDYDAQRDKYLEELGLKVFHTTDHDVLQHVNIVLEDLRKYIVESYEHEG